VLANVVCDVTVVPCSPSCGQRW